MKSKVAMQTFFVVLTFFTLAWFINTKASTIDWEHVFVLRVAILGLLSISLMIWSTKSQGSFKKTVEHKWFGYALGFAVVVLLFYVYVRPWVEEKQREAEMFQMVQERARVEYIRMHEDIEQTLVATKDRPIRIIPRSKFTRTTWVQLGQVSYTVTYPTNKGVATVVFPKTGPHKELPYPLAWMEFRPVYEDSVIMMIKQHDPP